VLVSWMCNPEISGCHWIEISSATKGIPN
jgi:hypothetical protein